MTRTHVVVYAGSVLGTFGAVLVAVGACTSNNSPPSNANEDAGAYTATNCPNGLLPSACGACIETSCASELAAVNTACASAFACGCPLGTDAAACTVSDTCTSAFASAATQCTSCNVQCGVSVDAGADTGASAQDTGAPAQDSGEPADSGGGELPNVWVTDNFGGATPSVLGFATSSLEAGGNVAPVTTLAGAATTFTGPTCVAFDASGNLWVVDSQGSKQPGQLLMFPAASVVAGGNLAPTVTISGANTLLGNPAGCAFDSAGALWLANIDPIDQNATVVAFSATQLAAGGNVAPAIQMGGGCNNIDLAFDSEGNLWVANLCSPIAEYAHSQLAAGGNLTALSTITQSTGVSGITFDSAGNLFTSLQGGVQGVTEFPAAQLADAGTTKVAAVTISGAATMMSSPFGVAVTGGNLWVVQQQSNALTLFDAALLTAGGNVAPTAVVSGANTHFASPSKIVVH